MVSPRGRANSAASRTAATAPLTHPAEHRRSPSLLQPASLVHQGSNESGTALDTSPISTAANAELPHGRGGDPYFPGLGPGAVVGFPPTWPARVRGVKPAAVTHRRGQRRRRSASSSAAVADDQAGTPTGVHGRVATPLWGASQSQPAVVQGTVQGGTGGGIDNSSTADSGRDGGGSGPTASAPVASRVRDPPAGFQSARTWVCGVYSAPRCPHTANLCCRDASKTPTDARVCSSCATDGAVSCMPVGVALQGPW